MTRIIDLDIIEQIQSTQRKIKMYTAVPMGILLMLYFFSFATLLDKAPTAFFQFELFSSIIFIFTLVFLNQYSFYLTRFIYRNKPSHASVLQLLQPEDIDENATSIKEKMENL